LGSAPEPLVRLDVLSDARPTQFGGNGDAPHILPRSGNVRAKLPENG